MKYKILHISFDYAENNVGISTTAVADLIQETSKISSPHVLSLSKTLNPTTRIINEHPYLTEITTFGLPYGIFHLTIMKRIKSLILEKVFANKLQLKEFEIIHAHKLTFEGIIGYYLAIENNSRLFVSIRQTDLFVIRYRKDLVPLKKTILKFASKVFFIAPFMKNELKHLLGDSFYNEILMQKLVYLPNTISTDHFNMGQNAGTGNLLTISWIKKKVIKRKNIYRLFSAIKLLNNKNIQLDFIGYGGYESIVKNWTIDLGIQNQINFLGVCKE